MTFQDLIFALQQFWAKQGCIIQQPYDMVNEGLITKEEAVLRIDPAQLDQLLHPIIDPSQNVDVAATGLPASPGAATGVIAFTADEAVEVVERDKLPVILVREETVPDDIHGMDVAKGILTARGGMRFGFNRNELNGSA